MARNGRDWMASGYPDSSPVEGTGWLVATQIPLLQQISNRSHILFIILPNKKFFTLHYTLTHKVGVFFLRMCVPSPAMIVEDKTERRINVVGLWDMKSIISSHLTLPRIIHLEYI